MLWKCDRFHALPRNGGILDQPFGLMARMRECEDTYYAVQMWKGADWHTFAKEHPDEWSIVERVLTLRDAMKTTK